MIEILLKKIYARAFPKRWSTIDICSSRVSFCFNGSFWPPQQGHCFGHLISYKEALQFKIPFSQKEIVLQFMPNYMLCLLKWCSFYYSVIIVPYLSLNKLFMWSTSVLYIHINLLFQAFDTSMTLSKFSCWYQMQNRQKWECQILRYLLIFQKTWASKC